MSGRSNVMTRCACSLIGWPIVPILAYPFKFTMSMTSLSPSQWPRESPIGDSRGHWEGDKLVIDIVNLNGYAKIGTIGHPMSEQAHLVMTFERPDMGRLLFNWTLTDPKTYTRPIGNERV